jgi:hypothetical protein
MSESNTSAPQSRVSSWIHFVRLNAGPVAIAAAGIVIITASMAVVDPAIGAIFGIVVLIAALFIHRLWRGPIDLRGRQSVKNVLLSGAAAFVAVIVVFQAVPYGRAHSNPPVVQEPAWDSPRTRELAVVACYDCHSNEVTYPWYSNVAPVSWAIQRHVDEGRDELNFSEWNRRQDGDDAAETVKDGSMPPPYYLLTHSEARLTDAEKQELFSGFVATFGR